MKGVGVMKVGVMEWSVGWRIVEEFLEYYPRPTCLIKHNAKFSDRTFSAPLYDMVMILCFDRK